MSKYTKEQIAQADNVDYHKLCPIGLVNANDVIVDNLCYFHFNPPVTFHSLVAFDISKYGHTKKT